MTPNLLSTLCVILLGVILRDLIGPIRFGFPCQWNLSAYIVIGVLLGVILWGIWA